ncbi:hypothetical protein Uis1B_0203 [Bifidobacterium margollesii]|uniref:Uncharacterized protein n=1 Tax=Bifidobacterium margollesii TaxID=2020964 RepID=A0A2N5JD12_9BIFI|nr:hypothetical protein Uis1B_0203 [Bifidobacterium margollesii]
MFSASGLFATGSPPVTARHIHGDAACYGIVHDCIRTLEYAPSMAVGRVTFDRSRCVAPQRLGSVEPCGKTPGEERPVTRGGRGGRGGGAPLPLPCGRPRCGRLFTPACFSTAKATAQRPGNAGTATIRHTPTAPVHSRREIGARHVSSCRRAPRVFHGSAGVCRCRGARLASWTMRGLRLRVGVLRPRLRAGLFHWLRMVWMYRAASSMVWKPLLRCLRPLMRMATR